MSRSEEKHRVGESIIYRGREIFLDDLPDSVRDIAEVLGLKVCMDLCRFIGGETVYIPKLESLLLESRDRAIRAGFNGGNYRALASQFRLSERQVRKIIDGKRSG